MPLKMVLVAALGSLFCLDRACPQFMISRPIVVAPFIGWVLGDVMTGLVVGAFLELMWVDRPAMGNYVPPGDSLVSAVVAGSVVFVGRGMGGVTPELIVLAVLLLLPLAYAAQRMDMHLMTGNDALSDQAMEDARNDRPAEIEKKHLLALGKMYLLSFAFILACTALAVAVLGFVYPRLPGSLLTALGLLYFVFPVLIIAVVLHSIKVNHKEAVFALLFAAVVFAVQWAHGF